jgi:hypothetical protein
MLFRSYTVMRDGSIVWLDPVPSEPPDALACIPSRTGGA